MLLRQPAARFKQHQKSRHRHRLNVGGDFLVSSHKEKRPAKERSALNYLYFI